MILLLICLLADEGMWPYNQFPKDAVRQRYNFEATTEFLDHLRLASVQIGGGSGAFVSPHGLLLTNQHLVASCLGDRVKDGFYDPIELKCQGLSAGPYTDIRLVFAPEYQLAFFGREHDSITYLRYGLDVAFLRAYENDKPAATPNFLKWSAEGVKDGDLVFAAGNPAPTMRSSTAAQLAFYRDTALPLELSRLMTRIQLLKDGPVLTSLETRYKLAAGKLIGLRDDRLVARKTIFENKIRHAVGPAGSKAWDEVATAYKNWAPLEKPYQILEGSPALGSSLFRMARQRVRSEPVDTLPVNEPIEILMLTSYLEELQKLGDFKKILAGRTAQALVKNKDEMVHFIELLEPAARKLKKKHDDMKTLDTKIAQYRSRLFGAADYPDANSTPRMEFGAVKGYLDRAGVPAPYASTFSGLYYRVNDAGPYSVPKRWVDGRAALNVVTTLDFVSTCDIGGGDYGSPVVNRAGELVGVTFDGNLESLPDTYLYTNGGARAVHVAAQGIVEALDKIYKATPLLRELNQALLSGLNNR